MTAHGAALVWQQCEAMASAVAADRGVIITVAVRCRLKPSILMTTPLLHDRRTHMESMSSDMFSLPLLPGSGECALTLPPCPKGKTKRKESKNKGLVSKSSLLQHRC